jgi:biopolymer transport protein ExbD
MRTTLTTIFRLVFASMALGQSTSSGADARALRIRISADGICYFLDTSAPCDMLGEYLLSNHLALNGHVDIQVEKLSRYETVAATLESLRRAGFTEKVGFINIQPSQ